MRKTGTPVVFASARRRPAQARTCVTEPAAAGASAEAIVWIESTTIAPNAPALAASRIASSEVSGRRNSPGAEASSRSARILTCRADSSALT